MGDANGLELTALLALAALILFMGIQQIYRAEMGFALQIQVSQYCTTYFNPYYNCLLLFTVPIAINGIPIRPDPPFKITVSSSIPLPMPNSPNPNPSTSKRNFQ